MMMNTSSTANMLHYKKQASHYKEQQVQTASKEQLLIMLYDGAIRFCGIAKKALLQGELEKSNKHLLKAQRIITEFMGSLDMEIGGEAAKNLFMLYEYIHYRLVQANIKRDPEMVEEALGHLKGLRETWVKAIEIAKKEGTPIAKGEKHHA